MSKKYDWASTPLLDVTSDDYVSAGTLLATTPEETIDKALALIKELREDWCYADLVAIRPDTLAALDKIVRALTGCPVTHEMSIVTYSKSAITYDDVYSEMSTNARYDAYVADYRKNENGESEYAYFTDSRSQDKTHLSTPPNVYD